MRKMSTKQGMITTYSITNNVKRFVCSMSQARSPEQWNEERGITSPPLCQGDGVAD